MGFCVYGEMNKELERTMERGEKHELVHVSTSDQDVSGSATNHRDRTLACSATAGARVHNGAADM